MHAPNKGQKGRHKKVEWLRMAGETLVCVLSEARDLLPVVGCAAFAHLRGIQLAEHDWLPPGCRQVTDAAFVHLRGIHTHYCRQPAISDAVCFAPAGAFTPF
jgi:hypothetical protein